MGEGGSLSMIRDSVGWMGEGSWVRKRFKDTDYVGDLKGHSVLSNIRICSNPPPKKPHCGGIGINDITCCSTQNTNRPKAGDFNGHKKLINKYRGWMMQGKKVSFMSLQMMSYLGMLRQRLHGD